MSTDFEFEKPTKKAKGAVMQEAKEIPVEKAEEEAPSTEPKTPSAKDYPPEELAAIFDAMLFENEYSEEVVIRKKLRVTFRTRSAKQIEDMIDTLDRTDAKMINTLNEKRATINLKNALIAYQGKDLSLMSEKEKDAFFGTIPGIIVGILLDELGKFDLKVSFACSEGEANF